MPPLGIPTEWVCGLTDLLPGLPLRQWQNLQATLRKWLADDVYEATNFDQAFSFRARIALADGLRQEAAWDRQTQK